jgi:hypothetical protein
MQVFSGSQFASSAMASAVVKSTPEVVQTKKPNQKVMTESAVKAMNGMTSGLQQSAGNQQRGSVVDMLA